MNREWRDEALMLHHKLGTWKAVGRALGLTTAAAYHRAHPPKPVIRYRKPVFCRRCHQRHFWFQPCER